MPHRENACRLADSGTRQRLPEGILHGRGRSVPAHRHLCSRPMPQGGGPPDVEVPSLTRGFGKALCHRHRTNAWMLRKRSMSVRHNKLPGRRLSIVPAHASSPLRFSKQLARRVEVETWIAREQLGRVAVAEVAQEVGLDMAVGEVLLLEVISRCTSGEEL